MTQISIGSSFENFMVSILKCDVHPMFYNQCDINNYGSVRFGSVRFDSVIASQINMIRNMHECAAEYRLHWQRLFVIDIQLDNIGSVIKLAIFIMCILHAPATMANKIVSNCVFGWMWHQ